MRAGTGLSYATKAEFYQELAAQCHALIDNESDPVANMANCAALVFNAVPRLNWAGFYLLKGGELVLGPLQGQPACVRIALGRGFGAAHACGLGGVRRFVAGASPPGRFGASGTAFRSGSVKELG